LSTENFSFSFKNFYKFSKVDNYFWGGKKNSKVFLEMVLQNSKNSKEEKLLSTSVIHIGIEYVPCE
jgi:hypothetical protein